MKRLNKKGFTMAELLIVVAIIAVLVAIAIPIFTAQLEKSREAVDAANIRSAYAEATAAGISDIQDDSGNVKYDSTAKTYTVEVSIKQTTAGWATKPDLPAALKDVSDDTTIINTKKVTIVCDSTGNVTSASVN